MARGSGSGGGCQGLAGAGEPGRCVPQPPGELAVPGGLAGLDDGGVAASFAWSVGSGITAAGEFGGCSVERGQGAVLGVLGEGGEDLQAQAFEAGDVAGQIGLAKA